MSLDTLVLTSLVWLDAFNLLFTTREMLVTITRSPSRNGCIEEIIEQLQRLRPMWMWYPLKATIQMSLLDYSTVSTVIRPFCEMVENRKYMVLIGPFESY